MQGLGNDLEPVGAMGQLAVGEQAVGIGNWGTGELGDWTNWGTAQVGATRSWNEGTGSGDLGNLGIGGLGPWANWGTAQVGEWGAWEMRDSGSELRTGSMGPWATIPGAPRPQTLNREF